MVAHTDCAGNPVADEVQQEQIQRALKTVQAWGLAVEVIGLWIDDQWQVNPV